MVKRIGRGAIFAGVVAFGALGFAVAAFGGGSSPAATQTIAVSASEFKFVLLPKTGKKGTIVFSVRNNGKLGHDFKIKGKKSATIGSGKRTTLRVAFTAAGRYPYLCTIPGHAQAGMKGTLVVK